MKNKRLALNTYSSIGNKVIVIICGIIVPRLILRGYGSETNGLINSITQFLQVISFLEMGIGAVVQSALYKPLANKDQFVASKIVVSAQKYFKSVAIIFAMYVIFLLFAYPKISKSGFSVLYVDSLIIVMSTSLLAQYLAGLTDTLLLIADQRGYVVYITQSLTQIVNTIACALLIVKGRGIHTVRLATSIIFLLRPIIIRGYINRQYNIDRRITYDKEPISQKWNGIAQHIAAFVLDGTDTIVLTILTSFSEVSVYSVYNMVVFGMKQVFISATEGVRVFIGNLWAKQDIKKLQEVFEQFEWILHKGVVFAFGCTGILIIPFVKVYTNGINDVSYVEPLFAAIITCANAFHCIRLPYNIMILAAGHYRQTQRCYVIAAVLNILLSIILVIPCGIAGVAIGTLVAMLYQTVWMVCYDFHNFWGRSRNVFVKLILTDVLELCIGILLSRRVALDSTSYLSFMIMAMKVSVIMAFSIFIVNSLFYRSRINKLLHLDVM
ncbi:MAG: sugar isomerase [Butyrivibrio sp.]|uniref:lipopolysaccharide biosynthesis protein n=1 Tax=Butyrivibrio sp. TaxID=28121 RepID=UPI001B2F82A3|nr:sugar isomerase [Butyrivibrio sp.]MBO6242193.1 sugar isomerase [Butyrivibrio sp.]